MLTPMTESVMCHWVQSTPIIVEIFHTNFPWFIFLEEEGANSSEDEGTSVDPTPTPQSITPHLATPLHLVATEVSPVSTPLSSSTLTLTEESSNTCLLTKHDSGLFVSTYYYSLVLIFT